MKRVLAGTTAAVVTLSLSAFPAITFAQGGDEGSASVQVQGQVQAGMGGPMMGGDEQGGGPQGGEGERRPQGDFMGSTSPMGGGDGAEHRGGPREFMGGQEDQNASSSEWMSERAKQVSEALQHMSERAREVLGEHFNLNLEQASTSALSAEELKQLIEQRREQLDQEEASTSPDAQDIVRNANDVRLAVHALLASKDLLGGIGQQVSQIAQDVNASLATTTVAEAQIKSRGFLQKLFFGGDKEAGQSLAETVNENQQKIQQLTGLLGQASTTVDVKATLDAQIQAMQQEQARLEALASQQSSTGLLGWLFGR